MTEVSLVALLCMHLPRERRAELEVAEGLEGLLRRSLDEAEARWSSVRVPVETFLGHLARHLPEGKVVEVMHILHGADLYLACACVMGDARALQVFEEHVLRHIPARLGRLSPNMVEESVQLLRERLLVGSADAPPRIAGYGGRGPLLTWVGIIAARIAGELVGQQGRHVLVAEPPEDLVCLLAPNDPESALLREDARQLLAESLRKAVTSLSEQERTLLRLHHFHGFSMDQLTRMYGGSRSGMARRVADARTLLLERVHVELMPRLKHDRISMESLLGLVISRLDVGLHQMLD